MAIYLGNTLLTGSSGSGGGGSTPIGGLAFFAPRQGTSFTDGQEVYTDPEDNTVWIRSGAQITSQGSGVLEASQYADSAITFNNSSTTRFIPSSTIRSNRMGSNFDGRNVVIFGFNGSSGSADSSFTLFQPDGTTIQSATPINDSVRDYSASVFYNSTHTFISNRWVGNVGTISLGTPSIKYVETSTLTGLAGYAASAAVSFAAPSGFGGEFLACVTNAGTADERHWWSQANGGSVTEHTFNSSAASGSTAWTSTGNTISAGTGSSIDKIQGDGNFLYIHEGTNVHEYNATTRALIRTIANVPAATSANTNESGLIVIPASASSSGQREFWFQTSTGNNNVSHLLYEELDILTAPFTGTISSRSPITLKDLTAGSTFTATNINSGRSESDANIYLWMRIA